MTWPARLRRSRRGLQPSWLRMPQRRRGRSLTVLFPRLRYQRAVTVIRAVMALPTPAMWRHFTLGVPAGAPASCLRGPPHLVDVPQAAGPDTTGGLTDHTVASVAPVVNATEPVLATTAAAVSNTNHDACNQ